MRGSFLLLLVLCIGCLGLPEQSTCDIIRDDYISKIDAVGMMTRAGSITESCPDVECKASEIYWWVIDNVEYIPDTEGEDQIQAPGETLARRGGDCEDISILMASLLAAEGIDANPVFSENHTLLLVCGLETERIRREIAKRIIGEYWESVDGRLEFDKSGGILELEYSNSWDLKRNGIAYVEPQEYLEELQLSCDGIEIDYEIKSNKEVNSRFIDNELEYQNYLNSKEYKSSCKEENFLIATGSCPITRGRFIVENRGSNDADIDINLDISCMMGGEKIHQFLTYLFSRNDIDMKFYEYAGETCLFFEASLRGEGFAYPGYFTGHEIFQEENYIIDLPSGECERFSM